MAIQACRKAGKYIGICGQGPSDHPDLARWLLEQGIESMSLNPDTVVETWLFLANQAAGTKPGPAGVHRDGRGNPRPNAERQTRVWPGTLPSVLVRRRLSSRSCRAPSTAQGTSQCT